MKFLTLETAMTRWFELRDQVMSDLDCYPEDLEESGYIEDEVNCKTDELFEKESGGMSLEDVELWFEVQKN